MLDELRLLFEQSRLSSLFEVRVEEDNEDHAVIRLKSNGYRLRSFELWNRNGHQFARYYHGASMPESIKQELDSVIGNCNSVKRWSDFKGDYELIFSGFFDVLSSDTTIEVAEKSKTYTKNSAYEGLALPDVDTSETNVLGLEFSWKEVIAIAEDSGEDNHLKKVLSKNGVYLQRSKDGASRYVGSAYGSGGIIGRWLKHLSSNGDAKHLNLYVLENGYNNLIFTVLEFTEGEQALAAEQRGKRTLGSKNSGPYDGLRLNRN
ncbi:GIY-YIG nuclease family protein [Vibrio alginolyticus]|nr:hypothetical protein [Vibrio alginolyticus]EMA2429652.1 hypothetical protein [Vibrio alginolyticus]